MASKKKVAVVYDWIDKWGGVERLLLKLHEIFPKAIFYTSYFNEEKAGWAKNLKIKTSFIQKFPAFIKKSRILSLPFFPFVFESFDFSDYDLVISLTSSFAKSIITKPESSHVCYLLTPTRFLWSHQKDYFKESFLNSWYLKYLRDWDKIVAQRPDKIISISETVRKRCLKYYRRNSVVVYPPFDIHHWKNIKYQISNIKYTNQRLKILGNKKYFLVVSRLEPYKKVDLAVKVFNKLEENLIIVGEGTEEGRLKQMAGKNITFLSKLSDVELGNLYSNAQALIMSQEEDFGYVALESQFFDCPVIVYKKGGAKETVVDGKTGIFFPSQTERALLGAIERLKKIKYNLKRAMVKNKMAGWERFSQDKFIDSFLKL